MNHLVLVDVLHTLNKLLDVVSSFEFVETFSSPYKVA
jgi:hypothetical protein